jgi:hypothetical protein
MDPTPSWVMMDHTLKSRTTMLHHITRKCIIFCHFLLRSMPAFRVTASRPCFSMVLRALVERRSLTKRLPASHHSFLYCRFTNCCFLVLWLEKDTLLERFVFLFVKGQIRPAYLLIQNINIQTTFWFWQTEKEANNHTYARRWAGAAAAAAWGGRGRRRRGDAEAEAGELRAGEAKGRGGAAPPSGGRGEGGAQQHGGGRHGSPALGPGGARPLGLAPRTPEADAASPAPGLRDPPTACESERNERSRPALFFSKGTGQYLSFF